MKYTFECELVLRTKLSFGWIEKKTPSKKLTIKKNFFQRQIFRHFLFLFLNWNNSVNGPKLIAHWFSQIGNYWKFWKLHNFTKIDHRWTIILKLGKTVRWMFKNSFKSCQLQKKNFLEKKPPQPLQLICHFLRQKLKNFSQL